VMLNRDLAPLADSALADWRTWWGGNLGTASERLVAGRVCEALPRIEAARDRCRAEAGWVMDAFVLRR
jgi:precorrin-6A synthase